MSENKVSTQRNFTEGDFAVRNILICSKGFYIYINAVIYIHC